MDYGLNFLNIEYLFRVLYLIITGQIFFGGEGGGDVDFGIFSELWFFISIFGLLLALLLIAGIVYSYIRIQDLLEYEDKVVHRLPEKKDAEILRTDRWQHIQSLARSENPNDWRQAIIEADIMLDELITAAGYYGETVGEKLKKIERGYFPKIQQAWDAHKVRNQIAHRGSDFILTRAETWRALRNYEEVFSEFYFIE